MKGGIGKTKQNIIHEMHPHIISTLQQIFKNKKQP